MDVFQSHVPVWNPCSSRNAKVLNRNRVKTGRLLGPIMPVTWDCVRANEHQFFGTSRDRFEHLTLVVNSTFYIVMFRGELNLFQKLFEFTRDWEITLRDVQQSFYTTIQHPPPPTTV